MFFNSLINVLNKSNDKNFIDDFSKVDPGLVRFFRTEYGSEWRSALEYHLYKKRLDDTKKAA